MPFPGPTIYPGPSLFPGQFGPGLIVLPRADGFPQVQVLFSSFVAGTATVTIRRTAEGRTMPIRSGINVYAVGGASALDVEVPFGVPATYQAEQFDANGLPLGFTDPASITVDCPYTWIHQPLSPGLAVKVICLADSAVDVVRKSPGQLIYSEGATVGVWVGSQRQGIGGTKLSFLLGSTKDADTLQAMFGGYSTDFPSVLCIRTPPPMRLPRVLFAACSDPHEENFAAGTTITVSMVVDEVRPPYPGLVIPLLRRKDIDAAFTTRAARAAAYTTRLSRDTDYTKAGLGG